ncbi:hypothetical protein LTR40_006276 [Exophiala xenobiotica]|nr:hypothetical protein LTR40_006276 [Exophiala xenobiotica]
MAPPGDRDILPDIIKPVNYDLSLFNLEFGGTWSYDGLLKIASKVKQATNELVINTNELDIKGAEVLGQDGGAAVTSMADVSYDKVNERATIKFSGDIPAGDAVIAIKYQGTMNSAMAGFYRSKYKPAATPSSGTPTDGEFHYMFSTQFEACDARRAFPCFDEPNLKASFEFAIEIPENLTAISNMPEKAVSKGSKDGLKKVSFEKTPAMSTYLAAWAVGDFEYVEDFTARKYNGKNIPVRVYTTRGLKEQGRFALEHAHKTLDYFSDVFGIEYPLPKSDLLAVHEFAMGAMENWGLVTYRTTAVLFDEEKSDARFKNRVAYVVAHELAHQWFGNLVTMDWWNELWLNEGFATWVGWLAVDHLHPEWDVWSQFVAEAVQTALELDSLRASHPIEVPVRNALEVDQIFDHISYLKGSSVIRMLSNHLGQEVFLKGVGDYLKVHAYGNARTNDLWAALSAASGQDNADLAWDLLEFVISEEVPTQDSHGGIVAVSNNNETRTVAWDFTKKNWERVEKRLGGTGIVIDRWIKMGLPKFSDIAIRDDIAEFFKDKNTAAFNRSLVIVSDAITGNANYKQRDEAQLLEWLKAHGYA